MKYLILLLFPFLVSAQTHRYIYDYHHRLTAEDTPKKQEFYHLDVNPDNAYYYDRKYFVADSLDKAGQGFAFQGEMSDFFMKDRNSGKVSLFTYKGFDSFKLVDQPQQKWKIQPETKMFGNLKIQKATSTWSGRNYEAWFAPELPFQEGPYKFSGLPGLIVELADDQDNFRFTLVRTEVLPEIYVLDMWYNNQFNKPVEISYVQYSKMLLQYYKSPLQTLITHDIDYKNSPLITDDGTMIDTEQKFRSYETTERNRIRKYNNPIELDLKVKYPVK